MCDDDQEFQARLEEILAAAGLEKELERLERLKAAEEAEQRMRAARHAPDVEKVEIDTLFPQGTIRHGGQIKSGGQSEWVLNPATVLAGHLQALGVELDEASVRAVEAIYGSGEEDGGGAEVSMCDVKGVLGGVDIEARFRRADMFEHVRTGDRLEMELFGGAEALECVRIEGEWAVFEPVADEER